MDLLSDAPSHEGLFGFLPLEMKVEIFNNLELPMRHRLRLVCTSWDALLSGFYGVNLFFCDRLSSAKTSDFQGPTHALLHCYKNRLLEEVNGQEIVARLQRLTYRHCIEDYNFVPILLKSNNVRILEFEECTVKAPFTTLNLDLPHGTTVRDLLPFLRTLKIDFVDLSIFDVIGREFIGSLKALLPLLTGKLRTLDLTYSCVFGEEFLWSIDSFNPQVSPERARIPPSRQLIEALIKGNFETLETIKFLDRATGQKATFKLNPMSTRRSPDKILRNFCETIPFDSNIQLLEVAGNQTQLQSFSVHTQLNNSYQNHILEVLKSNSKTLRVISITGFQNRRNAPQGGDNAEEMAKNFDATNLSSVNSLEILTLRIRIGYELSNLHLLPKTLRILRVSSTLAFPSEAHFTRTAFQNLENLQIFEFSAYPWFSFDGVGFLYLHSDKVFNFVNWLPSLRRFVLRNRTIPNYPIPMTPNSLPPQSVNWIIFTSGISYYLSTVDSEYPSQGKDTLVEIVIEPEYLRTAISPGSRDV